MERYRYRTCALLGPWRATLGEAVADAVRSNQARTDARSGGVEWLVPGEIERLESGLGSSWERR